jgi:hypothetical protein
MAHSLAYLRIALTLPFQAQGSLPTCPAVALVGRDFHPLDDSTAFPKVRPPSLQSGIAWSHSSPFSRSNHQA